MRSRKEDASQCAEGNPRKLGDGKFQCKLNLRHRPDCQHSLGLGVTSKERPTDCEANDCYGYDCRHHNRGNDPLAHRRSPSSSKGGARKRLSAASAQGPLLAMT